MKKPYGSPLGRQIIRSVVIIALGSVLMTTAASYLLYGFILRFAPESFLPEPNWIPSGIEWVVIGLVSLLAAIVAAYAAQGLARRILAPIISVAENARRMAAGDLTARAESEETALSELSILVDDFNLLGTRLEMASHAVTQWNATIAHELRTPVTILRGRIQGLADGVFKPEPQLLRSLETQIVSLARLIDDLRTVTLFDCGQLRADMQQLNLADSVLGCVEFMRPDLEKAGFNIVTAIDAVTCMADPARIRQALMALLENVRRHASPGRILVTLRRSNQTILLNVQDTGPGLMPEFEKHAFDVFERYMEKGGVMKGSGLGLSVVRAIADAHDGEASYATVAGGASFTIAFPG